jgi:heme exporter protein CcmB
MPTSPAAGASSCDGEAARRTVVAMPSAPSGLVRHAARVAWKDLKVELRSREILYTVTFFAALIVIVFTFTFPQVEGKVVAEVAPGMLWVAVAFAGTIGLGRAFDREREGDTMRALLLAPAPRVAVFLGKAAAIAVLMLAVALVVTPLLALFLGADLFAEPGPLALAVVLGAIGFSTAGSVFAAALLRVRARDVLLPVILYPLLIPLFVAATRVTSDLLATPADLDDAWYWIGFLGMFDAAFLVVSLWVFESLVIE